MEKDVSVGPLRGNIPAEASSSASQPPSAESGEKVDPTIRVSTNIRVDLHTARVPDKPTATVTATAVAAARLPTTPVAFNGSQSVPRVPPTCTDGVHNSPISAPIAQPSSLRINTNGGVQDDKLASTRSSSVVSLHYSSPVTRPSIVSTSMCTVQTSTLNVSAPYLGTMLSYPPGRTGVPAPRPSLAPSGAQAAIPSGSSGAAFSTNSQRFQYNCNFARLPPFNYQRPPLFRQPCSQASNRQFLSGPPLPGCSMLAPMPYAPEVQSRSYSIPNTQSEGFNQAGISRTNSWPHPGFVGGDLSPIESRMGGMRPLSTLRISKWVNPIPPDPDDEGQQATGEQELATKMLQIQSKRFYIDVKQNRRGRFMKVAEIGADGRRNQVFLALSTAAEFRDHLSAFSEFYSNLGPPNAETLPEDGKLKSETMVKDNRRYYLDLKENSRGRFLRVSQTIARGGPRCQIAIPAQGMIEFRDALQELLEEFGTDDGGYKGELPEGRHMRVENKNFYFDIGQNNRGIYMRVSEVKTNFRTAITIPEKSWSRFRDIFGDYVDKMKEGQEKSESGEVRSVETGVDDTDK